jgi:hypothetical protein
MYLVVLILDIQFASSAAFQFTSQYVCVINKCPPSHYVMKVRLASGNAHNLVTLTRISAEGGSFHNFVPFATDDLLDVHSREGRLLKIGRGFTALPVCTVQKSDEQWRAAATWAPLDDPEFALDSDEALYGEALEAPVMQVTPPVTYQKRAKSKVSVSFFGTLH